MMRAGLRLGLAVLLCMAISFCALAEGLELAAPLEGMEYFPQGASEEQAEYRFHYQYPQFVAAAASDEAINQYYQAVCDSLRNFIIPQSAEDALAQREDGAPMFYGGVEYQITANTDEYLSVLLTSAQFLGFGESETITANVFARDGVYAGQLVTLSQVMGMEQEDGDATGSASQLVYPLVWQIIQQEQAGLQRDYFEDLNEETLESVFGPETDFYMDEDGNLVFFVQSGMIAGEVEGVLTYPFALAELLSAVKE